MEKRVDDSLKPRMKSATIDEGRPKFGQYCILVVPGNFLALWQYFEINLT